MKSPLQPCLHPVMRTILMLLVAALTLPEHARAECKEFKIVEYEDRVEAVCVGEPLTETQKKANLEEEKRLELEAQRQRVEEQKQQREADRASKAQAEAEAAGDRKRRGIPPVTPQPPVNKNTTTNPQILYK
jgi:Skp family chaperone for outer membrane proteins